MTKTGKTLGIIVAGTCASIIAGCTAEQAETAPEQGSAAVEQGNAVAEQGTTVEASPVDESSEVSVLAAAPGCIERTMLAQRSLYIHNNCGNRRRVKVIIRNGADKDCFAIDPNQTKVVNWSLPGTFDRLDSC